MTSFQSSELTELPVVENSQLFAQRTVRPRKVNGASNCTGPHIQACKLTATTVTHSPRGPCITGKTVQNGAKRCKMGAKREENGWVVKSEVGEMIPFPRCY